MKKPYFLTPLLALLQVGHLGAQATPTPEKPLLPSGPLIQKRAPPPASRDAANPFYSNFADSDFEGFEWITAEKYAGIQNFKGKPAIVYKDPAPSPAGNSASASSAAATPAPHVATAYVDLETRLPLALEDSNGTQVYQYMPAPTAM